MSDFHRVTQPSINVANKKGVHFCWRTSVCEQIKSLIYFPLVLEIAMIFHANVFVRHLFRALIPIFNDLSQCIIMCSDGS